MTFPTRADAVRFLEADPDVEQITLHDRACAMRLDDDDSACTCEPIIIRRGEGSWHFTTAGGHMIRWDA